MLHICYVYNTYSRIKDQLLKMRGKNMFEAFNNYFAFFSKHIFPFD